MAENKQLTVAELLARARQENPDSGDEEQPKRRRRRSLEEGGVSVAELTGSFKAVDAAPQEAKHSSVPIDAPAEEAEADSGSESAEVSEASEPKQDSEKAEERKGPSDEDTGVINKVDDTAPAEKKAEKKPEKKPAPQPAETGVMPRVDHVDELEDAERSSQAAAGAGVAGSTKASAVDEQKTPDRTPAERPAEDVAAADDSDDSDDDSGLNIAAVLGLALLGIVIGVAIFLGFQQLWANVSSWLVVVCALIVTAVMVGAVKVLRTASDGLSMTLAALVGLVITLGPAALVL